MWTVRSWLVADGEAVAVAVGVGTAAAG